MSDQARELGRDSRKSGKGAIPVLALVGKARRLANRAQGPKSTWAQLDGLPALWWPPLFLSPGQLEHYLRKAEYGLMTHFASPDSRGSCGSTSRRPPRGTASRRSPAAAGSAEHREMALLSNILAAYSFISGKSFYLGQARTL